MTGFVVQGHIYLRYTHSTHLLLFHEIDHKYLIIL